VTRIIYRDVLLVVCMYITYYTFFFHEVVRRCWVWFEIECILYCCGIQYVQCTCFSQNRVVLNTCVFQLQNSLFCCILYMCLYTVYNQCPSIRVQYVQWVYFSIFLRIQVSVELVSHSMACFSGQRIKLAGQQTIDTQITYNRYTENRQ
jgi:hypothetical protein